MKTTRRHFARPAAVSLFGLAVLQGCMTGSSERATTTAPTALTSEVRPQHAQCLVCKYNADLACIDVVVDSTTPRYVYGGKTYFFCSEECRDQFAKDPQRYLSVEGK